MSYEQISYRLKLPSYFDTDRFQKNKSVNLTDYKLLKIIFPFNSI